jgi:hypothetical protein
LSGSLCGMLTLLLPLMLLLLLVVVVRPEAHCQLEP